jgi:hypothetical protein
LQGATSGEIITIVSTYEPLGSSGLLIDANPTELLIEVEQTVQTPVADLMDVVFSTSGGARDISAMLNPVLTGPTTPETFLNANYGRWTAKFPTTSTYYRVDYSENQTIKNAFTNAFSFEAFYMTTNTSATLSPLSSEYQAGAGIEVVSAQITLYVRIGTAWVVAYSGIYMETERYYHVVGTYDKATGKAIIYVDGEKKGEANAGGNFTLPATTVQWIAIGGDVNGTNSVVRFPLKGDVTIARMYGKALSAKEVSRLYKDVVQD